MRMEALEAIRDAICVDLDKIARKGEQMTSNDLERAHMMTDTVKNIYKIEMLSEQSEYSNDGGWEARGMYSNRRGYSRDGGYSREDGYSSRHMSYGNGNSYRRGYSRDEGMNELKHQLEAMMGDERLNPEQRDSLRRAVSAM